MPADEQGTLGASASAGMVLIPKSQNIPFPASEELMPEQYGQHIQTYFLKCKFQHFDPPNFNKFYSQESNRKKRQHWFNILAANR